jgi:hypothetical protein
MAYHEDIAYVELGEFEALLNVQNIVSVYESADYGGCCVTMNTGEQILTISNLNEIFKKINASQGIQIFQ